MKRSTKEFRGGFIKLHRQLLSSSIWESTPESWVRVFIALLLLANWKPSAWWDGTREITLEPGSLVTSVKHLALVSGVSEKQVRGCFNFLQTAGMAAIKTANKYTLVSITNWATYQNDNREEGNQNGKDEGTRPASDRRADGNSLRSLRSLRSISPLPPEDSSPNPLADFDEDGILVPQFSLEVGLSGDEVLVPILVLDGESLVEALRQTADIEEDADCVLDGMGAPSGTKEKIQALREEYDSLSERGTSKLAFYKRKWDQGDPVPGAPTSGAG